MIKKSAKVELMDFFYSFDKQAATVSRQAFAKAREKISYTAFKSFFEKSCELVVDMAKPKLHKGYRLLAIDGSSFVAGELCKLSEYFGTSTTVAGKAMCRISAVVDVLDDTIADAVVSPFSKGERTLAIEQVKNLKDVSNALYLFDRGYWSSELIAEIISSGQKFLMRLQSNNNKIGIVCESGETINLRRHSFTLPSGIEEVLITNISPDDMSDDELAWLYAKRWGAETKYLELKSRLQIDRLSGESVNAVLQDIYATLYMSNLVSFMADSANDIIEANTSGKDNMYKQKANKSVAIAALRRRFVDICLIDDPLGQQAQLDQLYSEISKSVNYKGKSKPKPRNKTKIQKSRGRNNKPLL